MILTMWGGGRRRSVAGPAPIDADDVDLLAVALAVSREVRAHPGSNPVGGALDDIEVVHVIQGQHTGQAAEPGIRMSWHQGENTFGLLLPMRRLIREAGAVESVPAYLRLAIDEPQGPTPDMSRLWFLGLPSGPY